MGRSVYLEPMLQLRRRRWGRDRRGTIIVATERDKCTHGLGGTRWISGVWLLLRCQQHMAITKINNEDRWIGNNMSLLA
jgi:hypothetical protein